MEDSVAKGIENYDKLYPEHAGKRESDVAETFYKSGVFKDVANVEQVRVKLIAGKELGMTPVQSMNSVYLMRGKVGYETKIFIARLKKSGKYDYDVHFNEIEDKYGKPMVAECVMQFYRIVDGKREKMGDSIFTMAEATRIGLSRNPVYQQYPKLMLFYRAASNGMKWYAPDVLDGGTLYEDYLELLTEEKNGGKTREAGV